MKYSFWKIAPLLLVCLASFAFSQANVNPDSAGKDPSKTKGGGSRSDKAKGKKQDAAPKSKKHDSNAQTPSDGSQPAGNTKSSDTQASGSSQSSDPQPPPVTPICRTVKLGPIGRDAAGYHSDLDKAGGVSVQVAGSRELIMCGAPANVDVLAAAVQGLSGYFSQARPHQNHVVRLFYFRKAKEIASAINNGGGLSTPVRALGDDLLVFSSESDHDDHAIHELKGWIALIDVPRPEVSLSAWSIQISSTDPNAITTESANIKDLVSGFNQKLHNSLQQGWRYLGMYRVPELPGQETGDHEFEFAREFTNYLTHRYVWKDYADKGTDYSPKPSNSPNPDCNPGPDRNSDEYCLGYSRMFLPIQPSLTNMLVALVASANPKAAETFVDCLESRETCKGKGKWLLTDSNLIENPKLMELLDPPKVKTEQGGIAQAPTQSESEIENKRTKNVVENIKGKYPASELPQKHKSVLNDKDFKSASSACERNDYQRLRDNPDAGPSFSCFRRQLQESVVYPRNKALLRSALADFLFHYKAAELYPQEFIPWNRGASAQKLDTLFNPLLVEFNRDLTVYLRTLNEKVTEKRAHDKKIDYSSEGLVTVQVLSGVQAKVNTTTQSYFSMPPVISVRDFLNATNGGDSGTPPLLSSNLTPLAAQSLLALLQSVQNNTTQVGRNLDLTITTNTLSGASSAEVEVQLDSSESSPPSMLDQKGNSGNDNVNRVAVHKTTTKVRVDSLKLFEVSSFSATLTHGRTVPLIPPFIDVPGLGNLARLHLPPGTVYHRSFAIISAVIVPTAADIANAIEFRADLRAGTLPPAAWIINEPADKPKGKPAETPTTTVKVKQSGGTSAPVSIQVGPGLKCAPASYSAPEPPAGKNTEPVSKKFYYRIVTHYLEGVSVSEPLLVSISDKNDSILLGWESPARALWFDIYRSDSGGKSAAVKLHHEAKTFLAKGDKDDIDETAKNVTGEPPKETVILSQIAGPPGNLMEFHYRKLHCLELEADSSLQDPENAECPPHLRTTPVTRFVP